GQAPGAPDHAGGARGVGRRHGDGGGPPREHQRPHEGVAARLHRPEEVLPAAQHPRVLHRGRRDTGAALRTARLGREVGLSHWVKLEVIGDEKTLFPDNEALLEATRVLVKEGFVVLPYTTDDPVVCRKLEDAGAAAVMPLGAPIGSGLGIQNPNNIRIIKEQAGVPVIVDAGVGTASDATYAMEVGAEGVRMNTGIALAQDPGAVASAVRRGGEG